MSRAEKCRTAKRDERPAVPATGLKQEARAGKRCREIEVCAAGTAETLNNQWFYLQKFACFSFF
jgi:hypothetical protein